MSETELVAGAALPEVALTPTRTDFVRFAGAGGDFNPVHHDEIYARELGHPSVFAMGMWSASIAARIITDHFGPTALRAFKVRFSGLVWPDQKLRFRAIVEGRRHEGEATLLDLALTAECDGAVKLSAHASVALR